MSKSQECTVDDGKCREHCLSDAYERQRERESLPYHNRNLNLGPLSVASFSLEVEAADYADKMERITGDFHRYEKELDGKYHVYGEE